jgi:peptidoglycan/xylan/chitin deacetylase (PgdA/CDA1 family)
VLAVVAALALWGYSRPMEVTVDGVTRTVPARATMLELQNQGHLHSKRGALLATDGKVLKANGGKDASLFRNGRPTTLDQRLYDGDVIESRDGADTTEGRVKKRVTLPIGVVYEGTGPVVKLKRLGAAGVAEITTGRVSGIETTRSVVTTGDEMVIVHREPTRADKLVALTFDDGPYRGQTEKILAVLKREGVHATFFMLGNQARAAPSLARRVAAEGHVVGSHSFSHAELTKLGPAAIRDEISRGISAVGTASGASPVWFRPPYGAVNSEVRKEARKLNVKVALWDIDTLDWTRPGTHMLYRNAVRSTKPGQVVLMHDGGGNRDQTIRALPIIIDDLRSKGFIFVTLDELNAAK